MILIKSIIKKSDIKTNLPEFLSLLNKINDRLLILLLCLLIINNILNKISLYNNIMNIFS